MAFVSLEGDKYRNGLLIVALAACAATASHAGVRISSDLTWNMSCSGGICSPTEKQAVLNVTDLINMLETADLTVRTGHGAMTISVESSVTWASGSRLTLDSKTSVVFKAPVVVAGPGGLTIATNDGGTGGDLMFQSGGYVDFWDLGSSFIINNKTYTLANSIKTLAAAIQSNHAGSFALANSFDASVDGTYLQSPVPQFMGTFEGAGHTISNLKIDSRDRYVGLFGNLQAPAIVRDILVSNASLKTRSYRLGGLIAGRSYGLVHRSSASGVLESSYVGALIGENYGTVSGCTGSGTVTGSHYVGGLVGINFGVVSDSLADATVAAYFDAGGLVGENFGTIERSRATGGVTGHNETAGGLVGLSGTGSRIDRSSASGPVAGIDISFGAGGLVGWGTGTISQSFASGNVNSTGAAGGLVGIAGGVIEQSYAAGAVTNGDSGGLSVGGLVGDNSAIIDQSYEFGHVSANDSPYQSVGGLIGVDRNPGDVTNAYWDLDTSGIGDPSKGAGNVANDLGITGLTDKQLKSALPAGFDPLVWGLKRGINGGHPYLLAVPPPH